MQPNFATHVATCHVVYASFHWKLRCADDPKSPTLAVAVAESRATRPLPLLHYSSLPTNKDKRFDPDHHHHSSPSPRLHSAPTRNARPIFSSVSSRGVGERRRRPRCRRPPRFRRPPPPPRRPRCPDPTTPPPPPTPPPLRRRRPPSPWPPPPPIRLPPRSRRGRRPSRGARSWRRSRPPMWRPPPPRPPSPASTSPAAPPPRPPRVTLNAAAGVRSDAVSGRGGLFRFWSLLWCFVSPQARWRPWRRRCPGGGSRWGRRPRWSRASAGTRGSTVRSLSPLQLSQFYRSLAFFCSIVCKIHFLRSTDCVA